MRARSIPQIRVVAFDAVGTLIYAEPSVTAAYRTAITRHGAPDPGQDEVRRIVAASLSARSRGADLSTSEEQEVAFWRQLVEQFFSRPDTAAACFQELWDHFADARNWRCFDDVSATLDSLQEQNIPVAVASNFDSRLNPVCDGLDELRTLGARFISSETGFRKPDPQFFRRIAEHYHCAAEEILFVGDDVENDARGAATAGCRSVLISRQERGSTGQQSEQPWQTVRSLTDILELL